MHFSTSATFLLMILLSIPLDGVVSKASSLTVLQDALFTALSSPGRGTEGTKNHWYINQS
ncbi:hypothetical protein NLN78_23130, partial [Citrobacter portucalensis]|nr:hypothetical protein [Citrobacter portucalensis]